jgi:hypothetical protein
MPSRIADRVSRVQAARALATRLRHEIDDRIHALHRHQLTVMSWMSRLTAGLASTLHATATFTWSTREAVGGGWLGCSSGILLLQRQLPLEIGNPFRLLIELFAKPVVLLAKPFNLLRLAITGVARFLTASRSLLALRLHQPQRTESVKKVQV